MRSSSQTPNSTHANATSICEMAFKAMALKAERALDYRDGYDFMIEGKVRVACRFAMPSSDRQQTYRKQNGEISTYTYKRWTFNFHRHGRITDRYCDFFVCFLGQPTGNGGGTTDVNVFVIPWESITGLTFCSSLREGSTRGYRGRYAVFQDAWHLIDKAAGGTRRAASRKTLRVSADGRRRLKLIVGGDTAQGAAKPKRGGTIGLRPKSAGDARSKQPKAARGSRRNVIQLRAD